MGLELLFFQTNYDQIHIDLLFDLHARAPHFINIGHMTMQTSHREELFVTIIASLGVCDSMNIDHISHKSGVGHLTASPYFFSDDTDRGYIHNL